MSPEYGVPFQYRWTNGRFTATIKPMAEALFAVNNEGELISSTYFTIDDDLLSRKFLNELLVHQIIERANHPEHWEWSFTNGDMRIDILNKTEWKVEFFVSKDGPVHITSKNLFVSLNKVTFH